MKILFDAIWWFDGPPSGRNVLRSLVSTWAAMHPNDEITLLIPAKSITASRQASLEDRWPNVHVKYTRVSQQALAAMSAGAFSSRYDVVLTQNFSPLFARAKRGVFIHDMMFAERPDWFTRAERLYLSLIAVSALRANLVFTSSLSESSRIRRNLRNGKKRNILPVGLALSGEYAVAEPVEVPTVPARFLLSVGRVNVRKNLEALVRALKNHSLIAADFPLVIVGTPNGAQGPSDFLDRATAEGSVLWAGSVSDSELKWLYKNCSVFIFPSLDEGFGLPVLEAIDADSPLALSDIPAFREFGDVGAFFNPEDDEQMANCVRKCIGQSSKVKIPRGPGASWGNTVASIRESFGVVS